MPSKNRLNWWPGEEAARWLSVEDAHLAQILVEILGIHSQSARVLEVGLWKGAWSHTLLMNSQIVSLSAIDPYPGLELVKSECEATTKSLGLDHRIKVFPSWKDFHEQGIHQDFVLVHIDGEHSEKAVTKDLISSSKILGVAGVIVVDDWTHWMFPGVISGTLEFMRLEGWTAVFATRAKLYLTRKESASAIQARVEQVASDEKVLRFRKHWGDGEDPEVTYLQSASMFGQPVLLCDLAPAQTASPPSTIKRLLDNWVPPIIRRLIQKIRK